MSPTPPLPSPQAAAQIALWRQLQGASKLLMAVRGGQSLTAALQGVDAALRPGVQALGFHTLRWLGRAQALRSQLASKVPPPEADALLCVTLALLWPEENAAYDEFTLVNQAVEAAKRSPETEYQASFINGCLRRFLRERQLLAARTNSLPQAAWNHPQWWIDQLRKDHPEHWQAILAANNSHAPLVLRVNTQKTSVALYLSALAAMNFVATQVGEQALALANPVPVASLPGFAEGHFSVQDAAAQLAAPLLLNGLQSAQGGGARLKILDACAAPGGKTCHLLEFADCEVTALDIDAARCERISQNLARLGLAAKLVVADAAQPEAWWDGVPFDGVLLDAPCTASGIVRRHPDVRWLRRPGDIAQLARVQHSLLEALWPLVAPGGRLLYCTCSVFLAEGQAQMQTFLAHHTDADLMASPGHLLPQTSAVGTDIAHNLPSNHDGFFYALLHKRPF